MDANRLWTTLLSRTCSINLRGVFDFDAVSADQTIIASISTSGSRTAPGKHATGKMMKLRSDILYILMTNAARRLVILCETDMYERCKREVGAGRLPKEIEFFHAPLPDALAVRLFAARQIASNEVSPFKVKPIIRSEKSLLGKFPHA